MNKRAFRAIDPASARKRLLRRTRLHKLAACAFATAMIACTSLLAVLLFASVHA